MYIWCVYMVQGVGWTIPKKGARGLFRDRTKILLLWSYFFRSLLI
jgi:hypothetical protein